MALADYGRCHRWVGVFDPQREPKCTAAVLAGTTEQYPGKSREQVLLAMRPFEHARESAGGWTRASPLHREPAALPAAAGSGRDRTAGPTRRARRAVGCRWRRART